MSASVGPRTLVVGPGAVGGFLAARLGDAGWPVGVLARPDTADALRRGSLRLVDGARESDHRLRIVDDPRAEGPFDLVLVCVKNRDTREAASGLREAIRPGAVVLSMQNGIESQALLAAELPEAAVAGVAMYLGIERRSPLEIVRRRSLGAEGRSLDRFVSGPPGDGADALASVGRATGVRVDIVEEPMVALWEKLIANVCLNTVTALGRARVGRVLASPAAVELMLALGREVEAVARADGIDLPPRATARYVAGARRRLPPTGGSSTLFDLEEGRPLEHDALVGAVVRAGDRLGVPVPVSRACMALLDLLDPAAPA